jgi:hypothetical protein
MPSQRIIKMPSQIKINDPSQRNINIPNLISIPNSPVAGSEKSNNSESTPHNKRFFKAFH